MRWVGWFPAPAVLRDDEAAAGRAPGDADRAPRLEREDPRLQVRASICVCEWHGCVRGCTSVEVVVIGSPATSRHECLCLAAVFDRSLCSPARREEIVSFLQGEADKLKIAAESVHMLE